jgi:hypothetical protein
MIFIAIIKKTFLIINMFLNLEITSATKKKMWEEVTLKFNSSSTTPRTVSELSKKWENLVAKHRAIFADYQRHISLTGNCF